MPNPCPRALPASSIRPCRWPTPPGGANVPHTWRRTACWCCRLPDDAADPSRPCARGRGLEAPGPSMPPAANVFLAQRPVLCPRIRAQPRGWCRRQAASPPTRCRPARRCMRAVRRPAFRDFLCAVLGIAQLPLCRPLSSVNLHFANPGAGAGLAFRQLRVRDHADDPAGRGGRRVRVRQGRARCRPRRSPTTAVRRHPGRPGAGSAPSMPARHLVLFRGRNAMHRVTPVEGARTRVLVLACKHRARGVAVGVGAHDLLRPARQRVRGRGLTAPVFDWFERRIPSLSGWSPDDLPARFPCLPVGLHARRSSDLLRC